jgi:hypothetical protein
MRHVPHVPLSAHITSGLQLVDQLDKQHSLAVRAGVPFTEQLTDNLVSTY